MELRRGHKKSQVGVIPEDEGTLRPKTLKVGSGMPPTGGSRVYKQTGRSFFLSPAVLLILCTLCTATLLTPEARAQDDFIAGYASALLEHEFGVTETTVDVSDGIVTVTTKTLGKANRGKLIDALKQIPGIKDVVIHIGDPGSRPADTQGVRVIIPQPQSGWLPRGLLFSPLHADPRWPHFSASYREFSKSTHASNIFSANMGETFSIYRNKAPFGGEWEFGIQAGVFSIFHIRSSSESVELINADYRVGAVGTYRNGRFSAFTRLQHQSSHLGDQYLIDNPGVSHMNLSFEAIDTILSYEFFTWLRLYGGGGVIVHRRPGDLGVGTTEWGIELTSPRTYWGGHVRPVAYADFQCNERMNWEMNRSILAGVQFENARIGDRQMQLLLEYYAGHSLDGQFYTQRVEWFGLGLHLYF